MTIEYVLLAGVNDSLRDADGLAAVANRLKAKVNLIPYSPIQGPGFRTPPDSVIESFRKRLSDKSAAVTVRHSKGKDILAACGQLAGR
jgi:23S rRNA (adenine2503-C2)-methyltransferase